MVQNIILGYGQSLTAPFPLKRAGSKKKYPYTHEEQRRWLGPQIQKVIDFMGRAPRAAMPRGESVARLTLHPEFLAKSYHPNAIFRASGLRCIGSKAEEIKPRKVTSAKAPTETTTAALFVAGQVQAYQSLLAKLLAPRSPITHQEALGRIEYFQPVAPEERIILPADAAGTALMEVALHCGKDDRDIVEAFQRYALSLGAQVDVERALTVGGLTFMPVSMDVQRTEELGQFSFLRVLRLMPSLRIGGLSMRSLERDAPLLLPDADALDPSIRVAIFDGGIGHTGLARWAHETVCAGAEHTQPAYLNHGNNVTGTFLFGPVEPDASTLARPFANVEHFRVISPALQQSDGVVDVHLYDVLMHIDTALTNNEFDFANFSLGPCMPIEDDEVHPWTALIDHHLAKGKTLAASAVGNDGELPWPQSRVQPPSDMVNALAVGACDRQDDFWQRASYSSYGPGRSPGLVKPDGLAFGGTQAAPLVVYNALGAGLVQTSGTSFSCPSALRIGAGIKASIDVPLDALTIRALLCQYAQRPKKMPMSEVGLGRFPQSVEDVLVCADDEVRVIYQGTLTAGENLRAGLPFPDMPVMSDVTVTATLCFASQTDPEHAVNYTRSGLSVTFRPRVGQDDTMSFFSSGKMYTRELEARRSEHKWETTLKHTQTFRAGTLDDPLFDIVYGAREEGMSVDNSELPPLPYAMVVTLRVKGASTLYNNVRQRFRTLQPLRLRQDIRLRT